MFMLTVIVLITTLSGARNQGNELSITITVSAFPPIERLATYVAS